MKQSFRPEVDTTRKSTSPTSVVETQQFKWTKVVTVSHKAREKDVNCTARKCMLKDWENLEGL